MAVEVERSVRLGFWPSLWDGMGLGLLWRWWRARSLQTAENRAMAELDRTLCMMGDLLAENELLRRDLDTAAAAERELCIAECARVKNMYWQAMDEPCMPGERERNELRAFGAELCEQKLRGKW